MKTAGCGRSERTQALMTPGPTEAPKAGRGFATRALSTQLEVLGTPGALMNFRIRKEHVEELSSQDKAHQRERKSIIRGMTDIAAETAKLTRRLTRRSGELATRHGHLDSDDDTDFDSDSQDEIRARKSRTFMSEKPMGPNYPHRTTKSGTLLAGMTDQTQASEAEARDESGEPRIAHALPTSPTDRGTRSAERK